MVDVEELERQVSRWLQPLPDEAQPCGPDLEYDNEFLELGKAAAGRPETQFSAAEPPDWRTARELCESLFERSRDLRVTVLWTRAMVRLEGLAALPVGLGLIHGLLEAHWDELHPKPDPDDGDLYARVNALQLLREPDGLLGDLRQAPIGEVRGVGGFTVRQAELTLGTLVPYGDETAPTRDQLAQMLAGALERKPALRDEIEASLARVRSLMALIAERFGDDAPDLRPLYTVLNGIRQSMPAPAEAAAEDALAEAGEAGEGRPAAAPRGAGLSGAVTSRAEAIRAIDLICEYLDRAEPTSPVQLLLRRARRLLNQNFLQLMKELAPEALSDVARIMGIDPETVQLPAEPG